VEQEARVLDSLPPARTVPDEQRLLMTAQREVLTLRAPAAPTPDEIRHEAALIRMLTRRWVRVSAVWAEPLLDAEHVAQYARWQARAGVQVRTVARAPVSVTLVDWRAAVVRAEPDEGRQDEGGDKGGRDEDRRDEGGPEATVLHCPETVAALGYLFHGLWGEAAPLDAGEAPPCRGDEQSILLLLARGLTDQQIARKLDISERTVGRTVARVMRELDVRSRFEAGVRAARLGWLEDAGRAR
jgi:DNA-binding CsgD family transcriptional regulator